MTERELKRMAQMSFEDMKDKDVIRLGSIRYDEGKPPKERVAGLLSKGLNPYFRRAEDGTLVKISFAGNGRTLDENMAALLSE